MAKGGGGNLTVEGKTEYNSLGRSSYGKVSQVSTAEKLQRKLLCWNVQSLKVKRKVGYRCFPKLASCAREKKKLKPGSVFKDYDVHHVQTLETRPEQPFTKRLTCKVRPGGG